jgi:hypothetical protein
VLVVAVVALGTLALILLVALVVELRGAAAEADGARRERLGRAG